MSKKKIIRIVALLLGLVILVGAIFLIVGISFPPEYSEIEADFKALMRQLFLVKRQVEMKWSEIEKICRPDHRGCGLYFYTKSGQRYFFSTYFYDVKLMPTIKRYKKYEVVYRWW